MTPRESALQALTQLPTSTEFYSERAARMRAAFTAGANVTEIARAAKCDRKDVYRAIRKEADPA